MASLTFTASDFPRFDAIVAQLERRARDTGPLMDRIGQALESSTIERFNEERAPDGSKWTPSERAKEEGGKTLTLTARLKGSITHRSSAKEVEVGTNVVYGAAHQFGVSKTVNIGSHKRRQSHVFGRKLASPIEVVVGAFPRKMNLPARPFLGVSADDEAEILAQAEDFLGEVLP